MKIDEALEKYNKNEDFFFIQIGANDANKNDPLQWYVKNYNWSGILVEPLPYAFKLLKRRYRRRYKRLKNLFFENSAIYTEDGEVDFYAAADIKRGKLSSLSPDGTPEIIKYARRHTIEKMTVPAMRLVTLYEKYNVKNVDLLQIDVEGFDDMVIKQIKDLPSLPTILNYEYYHLPKDRLSYIDGFLTGLGYSLYHTELRDCLCIRE
jgi:FkbM family methyltransferase